MKKNIVKRWAASLFALVLMLTAVPLRIACGAETDQSYTVTANIYIPGELNKQLPGVTAYITNGNNPLGLDGYEAKAPTEPVSDNATLTVTEDGVMTLTLNLPNPVVTLQRIGGCSNATVTNSVRDDEVYEGLDGSASRDGRITRLTIELQDTSGEYVFSDCAEFPTILSTEWDVPLTLAVDLSGVSLPTQTEAPTANTAANEPAANTLTRSINYDKLNALIKTVDAALAAAIISKDGSDVEPSKVWVTQAAVNTLSADLAIARAALTSSSQDAVDQTTQTLSASYKTFTKSQASGAKLDNDEHLGKTLKPGTYTVSANIWFNKADTGLPLNPHITNSTFPPMNPVERNAALAVKEDGTAKVTIPITIQDKIIKVFEITGLELSESETNEDGSCSSITVDMGELSGDSTVVTKSCTIRIEMGDLAMSISGLDKNHTWPAAFELNLSGVATKDGGTMPTVELKMLSSSAAAEAMASVGAEAQTEDPAATEKPVETQPGASRPTLPIVLAAVVVIVAAVAAVAVVRKRKNQ